MSVCGLVVYCPLSALSSVKRRTTHISTASFLGNAPGPVEKALRDSQPWLLLCKPCLLPPVTGSPGGAWEGFWWQTHPPMSLFAEEAGSDLGVRWGPHVRSFLKTLRWANSSSISGDHTHLMRSWLVWYSQWFHSSCSFPPYQGVVIKNYFLVDCFLILLL